MAEKKRPSVKEILAMARRQDGGGGEGGIVGEEAAEASPPAEQATPAAEQAPAAAGKPEEAAAGKAALAGGKRPSVKEMMALARAEKSGGAKAAPAAAKPAEEKAAPAKKPAAEKAKPAAKAPKGDNGKKAAGPRDTASILAAARKPHKPGPMSKSEAAAKGVAVAPLPEKKAKAKPTTAPPMPAKPDYARPKPQAQVDQGRRETFFVVVLGMVLGSSLALGFTSLTATMLLWLLGLGRFMFPNVLREPPSKFKVGFPSDFAPGQVETRFKAQFGVWIVNSEYEGQPMIYALQSVCTHLGCTPNWLEAEQKFKCPCHGSGFYKDGVNFEGPAPRPLERFKIALANDGQLEVDKSQKFQQEMGQWENPESFVLV